jgi:DNA-binding response OmpR family regulator
MNPTIGLVPSMLEGARILVVEDDQAIREILRIALTDECYDVMVAPNGNEALELLQGWTPQLIILDMMMPLMDGVTFRRRQRELNLAPEARLIVLSASRTAIPQSLELGADLSVAKPFELDDLLDVVSRTLERYPVVPDIAQTI